MLVTPKNGTACFTLALVMVSTGIIHLRRYHGSSWMLAITVARSRFHSLTELRNLSKSCARADNCRRRVLGVGRYSHRGQLCWHCARSAPTRRILVHSNGWRTVGMRWFSLATPDLGSLRLSHLWWTSAAYQCCLLCSSSCSSTLREENHTHQSEDE